MVLELSGLWVAALPQGNVEIKMSLQKQKMFSVIFSVNLLQVFSDKKQQSEIQSIACDLSFVEISLRIWFLVEDL